MPYAWIQCSSGASGDMLLAALIDAGASLDAVGEAVAAVGVERIELRTHRVRRAGLVALKADVLADDTAEARTWRDVRELLIRAPLAEPVREQALATFARLADAEARVHGVEPDEVRFHEVGALDAIGDIVGVCAAVHDLHLTGAGADVVAVGSGSVAAAHGSLPVPAPAVVALLAEAGAPMTPGPVARELCTPTGAALLATLVGEWRPMPRLRVTAWGVGAGTADLPEASNVLRVLVGETADEQPRPATTPAVQLEATVDDLDPRLWPEVLDRLVGAGADDAWLTAVLMRKGRPGHVLTVLTTPDRVDAVRETVLRETSTIGLRETPVTKTALRRTVRSVDVDGQTVQVKLAHLGGEVVNAQPEYDDVVRAATALGRPVKEVLGRVLGRASD